MPSHRVLTLSFEFHVPEGLRSNIRGVRIDAAIGAISAAVQSLAPTHFPWADRVIVRSQWAYRWSQDDTTVHLPTTSQNTVAPGDDEDGLAVPGPFVEPQP